METINSSWDDYSIEDLKDRIKNNSGIAPDGDGFIAEFRIKLCWSNPSLNLPERAKLFWRSPTRRISSCGIHSMGLGYGFSYITRAICPGLRNYTTVLGKVSRFCSTGDLFFESTDPRESTHMLLLPMYESDTMSDSSRETEIQRHSLMFAVNDDRWQILKKQKDLYKYMLLDMGYYYTDSKDIPWYEASLDERRRYVPGKTSDYKAQAALYRKLAAGELLLSGNCSRDLADEFFHGLTRDKVVNGQFLTRIPQSIGEEPAYTYCAIGADGNIFNNPMWADHCWDDNGSIKGVKELLWWDLPDDVLVVRGMHNRKTDTVTFESVHGRIDKTNAAQREALRKLASMKECWSIMYW